MLHDHLECICLMLFNVNFEVSASCLVQGLYLRVCQTLPFRDFRCKHSCSWTITLLTFLVVIARPPYFELHLTCVLHALMHFLFGLHEIKIGYYAGFLFEWVFQHLCFLLFMGLFVVPATVQFVLCALVETLGKLLLKSI